MIQNVIPLRREAVTYARQRATDERCALTLAELHLACIRHRLDGGVCVAAPKQEAFR